MRFSRLKKAIEATMAEQAGGEEEGGAGEAGGSEKAGKKRKREETAEVDGK